MKNNKEDYKRYNNKPPYYRIERLIETALCYHIKEYGDDFPFMTTRRSMSELLTNDNRNKDNHMHIATIIRNEKKMKMKFISKKPTFKGDNYGTCYYFDIDKITSTKEMFEEFNSRFGQYLPEYFMKKIRSIFNKKSINW